MTATILAFPVDTLEDDLQNALAAFGEAAVTSVAPAPLVRACQDAAGYPVPITVGGVPVSVVVTGPMTPDAIVETWERLRADAPPAGSRVRIAGGRVLAARPALGGAA